MIITPPKTSRLLACLLLLSLGGCAGADLATAKKASQNGDYATAQAHYKELAEFGIPEAQMEYAIFLLQSDANRSARPQEAIPYLEKAAAHDYPRAHFELGRIYQNGTGVPKDLEKAKLHFNAAITGGYVRAKQALGKVYEQQGDYETAKSLYIQSIKENYLKAAQSIGDLHRSGKGFRADKVRGLAWYYFAQDHGVTGLEESIAKQEKKLDPPLREQARTISKELPGWEQTYARQNNEEDLLGVIFN